jgi:hypothetical protein
MADLADVKFWQITNGIGHVVFGCGNGVIQLGCGLMVGTGGESTERPNRICKTCRKALKEATVAKSSDKSTGG